MQVVFWVMLICCQVLKASYSAENSFWLQKFKDLQKAALWISVVVITLVLLIQKLPVLTNGALRNTVNL